VNLSGLRRIDAQLLPISNARDQSDAVGTSGGGLLSLALRVRGIIKIGKIA
jgi:hypothetical protein